MDTHPPGQDDLRDLERRLLDWRPESVNLDADAMLFAAGIAAGRRVRRRFLMPVLCGLFGALAAGLGFWGLSERAERQVLARLLRERDSIPTEYSPHIAVRPEATYTPAPDDYWSLRQQMAQDPSRWLAKLEPSGPQVVGPPPPQSDILRAGQRDGLLDQ